MKTLVLAPHPDDELLGCGGTLLKKYSKGQTIGWILVTDIKEESGWSREMVYERHIEIESVRNSLGIKKENFFSLGFPTTELDVIPLKDIILKVSSAIKQFQPEELLLPHPGDVHSDHSISFQAAHACTKSFRYSFLKRVLTYETLSETEFGIDPRYNVFNPNLFIDISKELEKKVDLLKIYKSEMGQFPFPRSIEAIVSKAKMRGIEMGVKAAEAFTILKQYE
tara:strand:+ start:466 stop:1137 length:672 start_codon:yes stop_codon:yes gene_type:complete